MLTKPLYELYVTVAELHDSPSLCGTDGQQSQHVYLVIRSLVSFSSSHREQLGFYYSGRSNKHKQQQVPHGRQLSFDQLSLKSPGGRVAIHQGKGYDGYDES